MRKTTTDSSPSRAAATAHAIALPASRPGVKFGPDDSFQKTLKARVDRYFRFTGRRMRDCPQMYVKSAVLFTWLFGSYALLVFVAATWWQALPLAISLGMAMAAVGFNVQHDGGHKAYSDRKWVNKLAAMSLDLLGGSSYCWDHKHNTIHHTYANITDHDDDIDVGVFGRLSPHQTRLPFHRLQHIYLWFLYGFLAMKWHFVDDYMTILRGKIGTHKFARPKGWNLVIFIGGKAIFLTLAFGLPLFFHPFWAVVLFYAVAVWVNGLLISIVFQLAHVVEEAQFPMPEADTGKMATHWAVHQVQTTVNFARNNRILTWFLGGLNFQIEHHLMPRISHIHYPRLSRLVENTCKDFGLTYNAHTGFFQGVASHFRWLHRMAKPETV